MSRLFADTTPLRVPDFRRLWWAGVPTVIASLWPVDDASTARFMEHLYDGLAAGRTASAALEEALAGIERGGRLVRGELRPGGSGEPSASPAKRSAPSSTGAPV